MLLKRRSFKATLPGGELNIVSLMDVLTTLLFFLLVAANFSKLSAVSGFGIPGNIPNLADENKPKFTLEVILQTPTQAMLWLGPVNQLRVMRQEALVPYLSGTWGGNPEQGFGRKVQGSDYKTLLANIQQAIVPIKQSFPAENTIVLAISDAIPYQSVVDAVAALSSLEETKPGIEVTDLLGKTGLTKVLFPQVVISEWADEKEKKGGTS